MSNRAEYKDMVTESPYPASLPAKRTNQESILYSKLKSNLRKFQMDLASRVERPAFECAGYSSHNLRQTSVFLSRAKKSPSAIAG